MAANNMKNLYTQSKLLSRANFSKIEKAFKNTWTKKSALPYNEFPESSKKLLKEDKALGQCVPTSLIVCDLFGGRMIYDKANFHIWNELPDGTQQDFSRNQFKDGTVFSIYKYKTKEEILNNEFDRRTNISRRYQLLKKKFERELKRT